MEYFETSRFVPAPGQGALGMECRADDKGVLTYISKLIDPVTCYCVLAERAFKSRAKR